MAYAQVKFRDRGRIRDTRDAITLIGLTQLEQIILGHLRRLQLNVERSSTRLNHRIAALEMVPPPDESQPKRKRYANQ
jgi:hypothetical protein